VPSVPTLLVGRQEGHPAGKNMAGWWRWVLVRPDGVAPSRMVGVSTSTCVVRRSNNSFGDRCFAAAGPRLWNTLPVQLRHCDSLGQFKRRFVTLVSSAVYKLSYLLTYLLTY